MAELFAVKVDLAQIDSLSKRFAEHPKQIRNAVSGAINDTAKHAKSFIVQQIMALVNLKRGDVDKVIGIVRSTPDSLAAAVRVRKTGRVGLVHFGAKQTDKGVVYQIAKNGPPVILPHGFIVDSLSGNVFERKLLPGGKRVPRLPIQKAKGVSPWGVYSAVKNHLPQMTAEESQRYLDNRIEHRLMYQPVGGDS